MSLLSHRPYSHLDNDEDRFLHRQERRNLKRRTKLLRCLLGAVAVLSLLLAGVVAAAIQVALSSSGAGDATSPDRPAPSAAFEDALVVRTDCGEYVGTIEDGAFVFKGVPYAKAPIGHLRWKKPVPWWSDGSWCSRKERTRAHRYARPCFHLDPETKRPKGSEDCLYLNVWSPRLDTSAGLEVVVWLHGGFLQWGSGHDPGLGPSGRVAKRLNAVFVSFNYRLGALGFLALDLLTEQPAVDTRGNYGLWDQLVALKWIQRNIRAFGGDPNKVTVAGADGGAACALVLAAAPAAQGLFRAAWLLGPAQGGVHHDFAEASRHNRASFVARSGCGNATCLRRMSAETVARTHLWKDEPSFRIRDQNDLPIQGIRPQQLLVVDGELIKSSPIEVLQESKEGIPFLIGTAAQASDTWPGPDDLFQWPWGQLSKYVVTSLDSFGPGVGQAALLQYNSSDHNDFVTPEEVYSSMVSDLRQTCPVHRLCESLANTSRVYRYVITSRPSAPVKLLGYPASLSFHPWDAVAFFDHMEHFLDSPTTEDFHFRDQMYRVVRAFIRSAGKREPVPLWAPFPQNLALLSSDNASIVPSYHQDKCEFWEENGFADYAWVS